MFIDVKILASVRVGGRERLLVEARTLPYLF